MHWSVAVWLRIKISCWEHNRFCYKILQCHVMSGIVHRPRELPTTNGRGMAICSKHVLLTD